MKTAAYYAGLEAKMVEIKGMGWTAARDKFNAENPPGQRWTGSAEGLQYAQGEFEALVQTKPSGTATPRVRINTPKTTHLYEFDVEGGGKLEVEANNRGQATAIAHRAGWHHLTACNMIG